MFGSCLFDSGAGMFTFLAGFVGEEGRDGGRIGGGGGGGGVGGGGGG